MTSNALLINVSQKSETSSYIKNTLNTHRCLLSVASSVPDKIPIYTLYVDVYEYEDLAPWESGKPTSWRWIRIELGMKVSLADTPLKHRH